MKASPGWGRKLETESLICEKEWEGSNSWIVHDDTKNSFCTSCLRKSDCLSPQKVPWSSDAPNTVALMAGSLPSRTVLELRFFMCKSMSNTHTCTARNSCVLFNKCFHYWFTNLAGFPINVLKNELDLNHLLACFFIIIQKKSLDRVLVSNPPLSRYTLQGSSSPLDTGVHLSGTYSIAGAIRGTITLSPFREWCIVSLS